MNFSSNNNSNNNNNGSNKSNITGISNRINVKSLFDAAKSRDSSTVQSTDGSTMESVDGHIVYNHTSGNNNNNNNINNNNNSNINNNNKNPINTFDVLAKLGFESQVLLNQKKLNNNMLSSSPNSSEHSSTIGIHSNRPYNSEWPPSDQHRPMIDNPQYHYNHNTSHNTHNNMMQPIAMNPTNPMLYPHTPHTPTPIPIPIPPYLRSNTLPIAPTMSSSPFLPEFNRPLQAQQQYQQQQQQQQRQQYQEQPQHHQQPHHQQYSLQSPPNYNNIKPIPSPSSSTKSSSSKVDSNKSNFAFHASPRGTSFPKNPINPTTPLNGKSSTCPPTAAGSGSGTITTSTVSGKTVMSTSSRLQLMKMLKVTNSNSKANNSTPVSPRVVDESKNSNMGISNSVGISNTSDNGSIVDSGIGMKSPRPPEI